MREKEERGGKQREVEWGGEDYRSFQKEKA